jgi:HAD superfamily hydrolase (TIGR01509 family)
MSKGFIFDMDGVITNTEPLYLAVIRKILTDLNLAITEKELQSYVGLSSEMTWQVSKEKYGIPQDLNWLVDNEQNKIFEALQEMNNLEIIAGIPELIKFLQENDFKIGLATSSPRRNVDLILQKLQLTDCFEEIVSGEEVTNGKPHPEIFLTCAARLGVKPDHCFVLEDSPHGVEGANSANMKTIGFVNPNSGNQDLTLADYLTAKIDDELMNFIKTAL